MSVPLTKGANVSLTKAAGSTGLNSVTLGLGWDVKDTNRVGAEYDLDAVALVLGPDGKVVTQEYFVFYGNKTSPDGNVIHGGDNLTGAGDGDDEKIAIKLASLPADVTKVVVAVTIYEATTRGQNFGQVANAFVRVVNDADGVELARYDLTEDAATETGMLFGELYRHGAEWKFRAIGQGYDTGLAGIATEFGVNVA